MYAITALSGYGLFTVVMDSRVAAFAAKGAIPMPSLHVEFYSDALKIDTGVEVIYPQNCARTPEPLRSVIKPPFQVLYLLHGIMRDQTSWIRFTNIEQYVMDMGLVVVMPTTGRGHYINQPHGYRYFDYITKELPEIMNNMFRISQKREDTFIAGLSMGGYGALHAAALCPEQYAAAASLSGVVDVGIFYDSDDFYSDAEKWMTFDNRDPRGGKDDLLVEIKAAKERGIELPKMLCAVGRQDFLYPCNVAFYEKARQLTEIEFWEEDGDHVWEFWDRNIKKVLDWLPLKQRIKGYKQQLVIK